MKKTIESWKPDAAKFFIPGLLICCLVVGIWMMLPNDDRAENKADADRFRISVLEGKVQCIEDAANNSQFNKKLDALYENLKLEYFDGVCQRKGKFEEDIFGSKCPRCNGTGHIKK